MPTYEEDLAVMNASIERAAATAIAEQAQARTDAEADIAAQIKIGVTPTFARMSAERRALELAVRSCARYMQLYDVAVEKFTRRHS
jgi:hypothetical protein